MSGSPRAVQWLVVDLDAGLGAVGARPTGTRDVVAEEVRVRPTVTVARIARRAPAAPSPPETCSSAMVVPGGAVNGPADVVPAARWWCGRRASLREVPAAIAVGALVLASDPARAIRSNGAQPSDRQCRRSLRAGARARPRTSRRGRMPGTDEHSTRGWQALAQQRATTTTRAARASATWSRLGRGRVRPHRRPPSRRGR